MPMVRLPAALALRTNGAPTRPAATPPAMTPRRDTLLICMMLALPEKERAARGQTTKFLSEEQRHSGQQVAVTHSVLVSAGTLERISTGWNAVDVARRRRADGPFDEIA